MSDALPNQYAPPMAHVADVSTPTDVATLKLFSAQGRVGRLRYLAYTTGASLIYTFVSGVLIALVTGAGAGQSGAFLVTALCVISMLWFTAITGIKRCHDMNISGWWTLTLIIPLISLAWIFVPGTQGANRFGPPPPPNTWGTRLLGLVLPLIFFVGGIVAAVSIPAYQSYVQKARSAQATSPQP